MKRFWLGICMLALAGMLRPSAWGIGLIVVEDARWWPGPIPPQPPIPPPVPPPRWPPHLPPRPHLFAPLEIHLLKIETKIQDQVAVTMVDQEFYNPNPSRLEGTFVLPLPKGAQIDKFTMEIDGKQVQAELLTADKARHIYEDIVRNLRDPALMEYAGRDVFKVRIFPIEPNGRKRITLAYTQLLKSDEGLVSYVLPLNTQKYSAKPIRNVSVRVTIDSGRPLKTIYSPSHTVEVKRDGPRRATAGYEAGDVQPDTDFALYFAPEKGDLGLNLLTHRKESEDGYFLLLAAPGVDVKEDRIVQKDVVFVLDTSGSMAGKKLDQAKSALLFCSANLNAGDRFEIIRFSTEVEPLFDGLLAANKENREKAEDFIKRLKPTGGTAIDDALKKALSLCKESLAGGTASDRPLILVFLTDGRPTIGTTDERRIVSDVKERNRGKDRIFCFGIGTDVNTHLLDKIAEETRAFSQYVLPEEDLELKVSSFFSKIKEPVLANPTLRFTGQVRTSRYYPSTLPDLFKGEQLVLVGRYSGSGDAALLIEGTVNGKARQFNFEGKFAESSSENDFIPRLWATRRVGYLLDEIRLQGENPELRDEVTDLARKYGIVTPYTAYLIVEDESRRGVPAEMQSLQQLHRDEEVRRQAAQTWGEFKEMRAGESAVAGARYGMVLKSADAAAPAAVGGAFESRRALGLPTSTPSTPGSDPRSRLLDYSNAGHFAGGRNFFLNEDRWVDSLIQKHPNAKRVRIQFGSTEYFDLGTKRPAVLPWLALGPKVQFFLENTVYEIHE